MKDIKNYEGKYAVTSCGQVWSYKSKKFLQARDDHGYAAVGLYDKDGKRKSCLIHRLVAEAYLPNPDNLPEVHHIDTNRKNNCINNLQWMNKRDNLIEMYIRQLKNLGVTADEILRRLT